jgi:dTMP kinase
VSGRIIVVEGLDGVGKTTLSKLLARALGARWMTTPDPAVRRARKAIDETWGPDERALFYAASVVDAGRRAERLAGEGHDVVIDRYWCTTVAYARVAGAILDLGEIERQVAVPDATLWVTASRAVRERRLARRGATAADRSSLRDATELERAYASVLAGPVGGTVFSLDASERSPADLAQEAERIVGTLGPAARLSRQLRLFSPVPA